MTESPYVFSQDFGRDPLDRRFARGIYIQHKKYIGVIEREREFVHQFLRPRVTVRLENDDRSPAACAVLRGFEGRQYLGRMVAVIVDHGNAANIAFKLKTPVRVSECCKCRGDLVN